MGVQILKSKDVLKETFSLMVIDFIGQFPSDKVKNSVKMVLWEVQNKKGLVPL